MYEIFHDFRLIYLFRLQGKCKDKANQIVLFDDSDINKEYVEIIL